MPASKATGKTRGSSGTHAHYAGEFGSTPRHQLGAREQTSTLAKNPEYRAARAEHFAHVAHRASEAHAKAHAEGRHADSSQHALAVAHAHQMAQKHAMAAEKMAPSSEHARSARNAALDARSHHSEVENRSSDIPKASINNPEPHRHAELKSDAEHYRQLAVAAKSEHAAHPRVRKAAELTDSAMAASARAVDTRSHDAAAAAHAYAITENRAIGNRDATKTHSELYEKHAKQGSGLSAHNEASDESQRAHSSSSDAHGERGHRAAQMAHSVAARALDKLGYTQAAEHHRTMSAEHREKSMVSTRAEQATLKTISDRANQVSAVAKVSPSAAAHADAAAAHDKAAAAQRRAGHISAAIRHEEKSKEHHELAKNMMAGHNSHFDAKSAVAASNSFNQRMANITHGTSASKAIQLTRQGEPSAIQTRKMSDKLLDTPHQIRNDRNDQYRKSSQGVDQTRRMSEHLMRLSDDDDAEK